MADILEVYKKLSEGTQRSLSSFKSLSNAFIIGMRSNLENVCIPAADFFSEMPYDTVVQTSNDLIAAVNDTNIRSIFVKKPITGASSLTASVSKIISGASVTFVSGSILSFEAGANVYSEIIVSSSLTVVRYAASTVNIRRISGNGNILSSASGNSINYECAEDGVVADANFIQKYWDNTFKSNNLPKASNTIYGVVVIKPNGGIYFDTNGMLYTKSSEVGFTSISDGTNTVTAESANEVITFTTDNNSISVEVGADENGKSVSISHTESGAIAGDYGPSSSSVEPGYSGSFSVPKITVDAQGHLSSVENASVKIPDASGISIVAGGSNCQVTTETVVGTPIPTTVYHVNSYQSRTIAGDRLWLETAEGSTEFSERLQINMFEDDINTLDAANSLIHGSKDARAFPMSDEESRIIKIATITDNSEDNKWHIDFKIHFKIAQTTLSFMQDQFNEQNHFRFTYDNESCNESWVYNQETGAPGVIRIIKTATVDNVCSYYLVAYHGFSSEAEEIEIIEGHVTGALATFNIDAYALLSSIAGGDNYFLVHKVRRDATMTGTGSYYDPLSAKPTQVSSTDESIEITSAIVGGVATHDLALKNPEYFVKGTTAYGGTVVAATTGDLDIIAHTNFFTCYFDTLHAPPAQTGNPSWFVLHMNSNVGVVSAIQVAYAYVNTSIICYERVKLASTWGAWILRSSGGGTTVSPIVYDATMDKAGAVDNVALNAGSETQWSAHGTLMSPKANMTPVVNTSSFKTICPQPVSGASYIIAAYKTITSGTHELICSSSILSMPSSSSVLEALITRKIADIVGGDQFYFTVFTNGNGIQLSGIAGSNLNMAPYISGIKNNLGVLTEAPSTITFDGETGLRLFGSIRI